ncbi:MAG TPA: response regulator [Mycobacteriales bacterium]|nr:response regulator [Mycobacteriales bacterium]
MTGRAVRILLVEDNPGDVRLTREALRRGRVANTLDVVGDGDAALAYLRREGAYAGSERPDLVLLDLNLPGLDGRDVLAEVKKDESLRRLPIIVLTTSAAERDIGRSYDLGANCYVTKPVELADFLGVVRSFEDFWLSIVKLPEPPG